MPEKTLGEIRVNVDFNPSKKDAVNQLKQNTAKLINDLEYLKDSNSFSEENRLIDIAQTKYEEAAMWAVKAATHNMIKARPDIVSTGTTVKDGL